MSFVDVIGRVVFVAEEDALSTAMPISTLKMFGQQQRGIFQAVKNLIKPSPKKPPKNQRRKKKNVDIVEEAVQNEVAMPNTIAEATPSMYALMTSQECIDDVRSIVLNLP